MDPPWSVRIQDEAPLTLVAMVRGEAWVVPDDGDAACGWAPATWRSSAAPTRTRSPTTRPRRRRSSIHPGQRCTTPDGRRPGAGDGPRRAHLGQQPRRLDDDARSAPTSWHGEVSQRLLGALPPLLVLRGRRVGLARSIPLLADEIVKDEPGQEAVLDRLLDLLLIAVLRAWFARPEAEAPAWYRAHGDPVVGRALRLLHNNPAHPWTVASLAAETGVSRAALARRFTELVGEPPMTFLTGWRLALAADLLREPGRHRRRGGPPGRLRQPVRAQHRVQAGPRRQPAGAPRPRFRAVRELTGGPYASCAATRPGCDRRRGQRPTSAPPGLFGGPRHCGGPGRAAGVVVPGGARLRTAVRRRRAHPVGGLRPRRVPPASPPRGPADSRPGPQVAVRS